MLLLVVGAGAFFGKVISATGIGTALADTMSAAGLPVIVLAYIISCGLRIAQGSATVAIVTTGGIVAPLVHGGDYSQMAVALIAMAIAAGLHHPQPRQRRRLLDHLEVLQHDGEADAADLDGAGNGAVGGELRRGGGVVRDLRLRAPASGTKSYEGVACPSPRSVSSPRPRAPSGSRRRRPPRGRRTGTAGEWPPSASPLAASSVKSRIRTRVDSSGSCSKPFCHSGLSNPGWNTASPANVSASPPDSMRTMLWPGV